MPCQARRWKWPPWLLLEAERHCHGDGEAVALFTGMTERTGLQGAVPKPCVPPNRSVGILHSHRPPPCSSQGPCPGLREPGRSSPADPGGQRVLSRRALQGSRAASPLHWISLPTGVHLRPQLLCVYVPSNGVEGVTPLTMGTVRPGALGAIHWARNGQSLPRCAVLDPTGGLSPPGSVPQPPAAKGPSLSSKE